METIPSFKDYSTQVRSNNTQAIQTATNPIQQTTKTIDKKKLAVGVAAGIGITALIVGGLLYKHKIDSAKVKELAEHIDFKPAQTLEEAIEFGKQNLKIGEYKGFTGADLDVVNWVNEGLVNVNNLAKGKAIMPKEIVYSTLSESTVASMSYGGVLTIAKGYVQEIKSMVKIKNKPDSEKQLKSCLEILSMTAVKFPSELGEYLTQANNSSAFSTIYHEMGHLQHSNNNDFKLLYALIGKPKEITESEKAFKDICVKYGQIEKFDELRNKSKELIELFNSKINLAKGVSDYATTSPCEFVAEVFSCLCDSRKLSQETLDLYQKLGGVMF